MKCRRVRHMTIKQLPYGKPARDWLKDRYGETEANRIWEQTQKNYQNYLPDLPDYGGSKNSHAKAIYGGLLIFALYTALPDQPPVSELQDFVQNLFMGPFTKLGKFFDLNRPSHMRLIDKVFRKSGNRDRKDILKRGFSFWQFFLRFIVMLYLWKAFDIICLDWLLLTRSHFFQYYYPETEGCAGYHQFGFNRKEQLTRIILFPFVAALMAGTACLIGGRL
ncbi:MAG: hypothetical protein II882_03765 [Lachnospiraceae bacterium]|nr:hypothetical protein [Lachnospiraceae bacterium]